MLRECEVSQAHPHNRISPVNKVLSTLLLAGVISSAPLDFAVADELCNASWYGPGFQGKDMANGKPFDMNDVTVIAHKTLPLGTAVSVTNLANNKVILAVVKDRGPYVKGRCVDLSKAGAKELGFLSNGTARVRVQRVK